MGVNLIYGINTHVHADHVTGTGELKQRFPNMRSVLSKESTAMADIHIAHGDKIEFGNFELEVRATPGHTNGKFKEFGKMVKLTLDKDIFVNL